MDLYLARMPVSDRSGTVCGYELLYEYHKEFSSSENVFFGDNMTDIIKNVTRGIRAFLRFGNSEIKDGAPKRIRPENLAVEITAAQLSDENLVPAIDELRALGYKIVLDDFSYSEDYGNDLSRCDIVKVNFRSSPKEIEETAHYCRSGGKLILADNIETPEEFDYAVRLGCSYMEGFYFARPTVTGEELNPLPANIARAMALMSQPDPEIDDIVDVLSQDAAICRKLLKLINSVYFGVSNKVSAISQAIIILGLDYLREWVCLLGMQRITGNDNEEAIRLSLLNAKFCAGLAERIPEAKEKSDSFYLMGLLSMGVFSGKKQLAKALGEFPLSDEIKAGLLRKGGLYSDVLEMTLSYNRADWKRFDELARQHGLNGAVISDLFVECTK